MARKRIIELKQEFAQKKREELKISHKDEVK